jgi:membrane fusion protein (multidrug efflux system)
MEDAGKLRRRRDRAVAKDWTQDAEAAPRPQPSSPGTGEDDPIGGLLGTPAPVASRRRRAWRAARFGLIPILLLGVGTPVVIWLQYQSQHVTSKNAAVRGHLAEIGTRLTGQVAKVEVDVGDKVVAGQILIRLEDRHLRAEVQEARAQVAGLQRTIEVERMDIAHERRKIGQQAQEAAAKAESADAQTEAARIRADEARRNRELRESLYARDGVVSRENVRDAETQQLTAAARLDEAKANSAVAKSAGLSVRLAGDAVTIQDRKVGVLEADLLRAQARLERAEADLDSASIRAPEDGSIVRRIVQPGGSVEAGQPIIVMRLGHDVWIEAWVDEDDIGFVRVGSIATVTFHSLPGREFTGVVDNIGLTTDLEVPAADVPKPRSSRMRSAPVVGLRIRLEKPPPELVPGLSAVVAIRKAG